MKNLDWANLSFGYMPTDYNVPCLMTDHIYRMGIVWQQTAYNQPPHLGYRLADRAVDTRRNKK